MLPLWAGRGERHPNRRPVAVLSVIFIFLGLGVLTLLGYTEPWSPHMNAWSGVPTPPSMVKGLSPLQLQGAALVQSKQCRNCHSLDGLGGQRGPDLTNVATRLTENQLIRQILQGDGNMPAYGNRLKPYEVTAIVSFLSARHPAGQPRAQNSATPASPIP